MSRMAWRSSIDSFDFYKGKEMFTKKLVEKDVEVTETITKIEKRLVDVYVFEEEEYTDKERLRREINQRMGRIFTR